MDETKVNVRTIMIYGCDTVQPLEHYKHRAAMYSGVGNTYSCSGPHPKHTSSDNQPYTHEYVVNEISFIGRYLTNADGSGEKKALTEKELEELSLEGKKIVSIFEIAGKDRYAFANKGDEHARLSIDAACRIGQYSGTPIFFAYELDTPATSSDQQGNNNDMEELVEPYFYAIVSRFRNPTLNPNGYKVGVYANGDVCKHLMKASVSSGYKADYAFLAGAPRLQGYKDCDCWNLRQSCTHTQLWYKGIAINVDWVEIAENTRLDSIAWGHRLHEYWQEIAGDHEKHYKGCLHNGCDYTVYRSHNYLNWYANDNSTHSRRCEGCGHIQTGSHVYETWSNNGDGTHSSECSVCGYRKTQPHSLTYTNNGASGHITTCSVCGYRKTQAHTKSYSSNGTSGHTVTCTKSGCNYSATEEHTMSSWSDCGDGRHKRECTKCGYVEYSGHVYNEWEDNGTTHKRTCRAAGCSYTQTEEHTYGSWVKLNNDRHRRTCSKCGKAQTQLHGGVWVCTPDKLGHRKHCSTCGADIEEIHTMSNGTCTKCGYSGGGANPADNIGDENE